MKVKRSNTSAGYVAVFWLDGNKVYANKSPLNQGEEYGDFIVHKSCHFDSWSAIKKQNPKWNGQYEDYWRGRCVYHRIQNRFYIYVCPLVKGKRKIQKAIVEEFHLQNCEYRFDYSDEHYILQTF